MSYRKTIDDVWSKINSVQEELENLDEGENARVESLLHECHTIDSRLMGLMNSLQPSTRSTPINLPTGESSITSNPIAVKLPDLRLPTFDGYLEKWSTFYDTFSSTIDKEPHPHGHTEISLPTVRPPRRSGELPRCVIP